MIVEIVGDIATLHSQMTAVLSAAITRMEGRRRWPAPNRMVFYPTPHNLAVLRSAYASLDIRDHRKAPQAPREYDADGVDGEVEYHQRRPSRPHQARALGKAIGKDVFALFADPGTGKTKVAIDLAGIRYARGEITGLLVMAPKGVHRQWIEHHMPQNYAPAFDGDYYPPKFGADGVPARLRPGPGLKVLAMNHDGPKTEEGMRVAKAFIQYHGGRVLLVYDESQAIKNKGSQRWEAANELGQLVKYRAILTGTPIAKDLTDEWAQLYWLDPNIIGVKYKGTFQSEYCRMGGWKNKQVIGMKNFDRFKAKVDPYSFRITADQIGILPPVRDSWTFKLKPVQKRMIAEIKKDLMTQTDGGQTISVKAAVSAIIKCQQIASGLAVMTDGTVYPIFDRLEDNPRIAAAIEYVEAFPGKMIIWARFTPDIVLLAQAFKGKCVTYFGDTKDSDRAAALSSFMSDDGADLFISNPAAGGTGLDGLQEVCQRALYYSHSDKAVDRWQSEARIRRMGAVGVPTFTDMICGSIDHRILRNHQRKKELSQLALGDLQNMLDVFGDDGDDITIYDDREEDNAPSLKPAGGPALDVHDVENW